MLLRPLTPKALALGLALIVSAPSIAQQEPSASHLAAARELVLASGASTSIDRIMPAIIDQIRRQIVTRPDLVKDLEEVVKTLQPEMDKQREQAIVISARTYAKWLSEAELKDATTFFRSTSGAKYVRVQPDITEDLVNGVSAWTQLAAEYVQTRIRAEMLKRGHQMQ